MTANQEGRDATRATPDTARQGRIPADTFANRLLLARRLAGMTIEQAAAAAGLNSSSWSNWENGMRPQGQVDIAGAIAEALDVDFNWLLLGGPLAGPRGLPTKRRGGSNLPLPRAAVRPRDTRPPGGPAAARRTPPTTGPGAPRRPVRISGPVPVAASSR